MFAWADVSLHQETYDWADAEPFAEPTDQGCLRPYANGASEVDFWRLELLLNHVGKAFLVVDEFATVASPQLTTDR